LLDNIAVMMEGIEPPTPGKPAEEKEEPIGGA